jgi:hypothetical protein
MIDRKYVCTSTHVYGCFRHRPLFLEIRAHHGRWKDYFLSPLLIRILKHNKRWWKHPHPR